MRVRLRVHPAGLAALAAALLFFPGYGVLAAGAALLLHEGCHLLMMALCGVKQVRLELTPFGGVADVPGLHRLSWGRQLWISLAGVAGSALAALGCVCLSKPGAFLRDFLNANLAFVFLNCLPLWPLDGARVVMILAGRLGVERSAGRVMLWLAYGASAALLGLGVYGACRGHVNPSLFALAPYLAYAAYESAICQQIRGFAAVLGQEGTLKPGETRPVQSYACVGEPASAQLAGLLRGAEHRRVLLLHVLSRKDGTLQKTMSQAEMGRKLLDETFYQ